MINNEAITLNDTVIECIRWCILVPLFFVALSFVMKIVIFIIKGCTLKEILYKYYKYRWSVAFGSGILSMIIIFWKLFAYVFNQGELFRISMDTRISTKMEDWGGFATCVTAIFALVSVFLAFKALRSQTTAARRASFDATFTQIFAQHNILYQKVTQHYILYLRTHINLFTYCRTDFHHMYITSGKTMSIRKFWKRYNTIIGLHVSADFKNYFKYIHREVSYIMDNSKGILRPEDQKSMLS